LDKEQCGLNWKIAAQIHHGGVQRAQIEAAREIETLKFQFTENNAWHIYYTEFSVSGNISESKTYI